jgi:uncharacterized protein (DUF983 family)
VADARWGRRTIRLGDAFRPLPPSEAVREARRERRLMLRRALRGHCPLCASGGIRDGWSSIRDRCPGCNLAFSRERGYLVGAAWFNLTATLVLFSAVLMAGILLSMPDIPWAVLTAASLATVVVAPIVLQPFAVALWLWVDLAYFRPLDAGDLAANDADRRG